jgi:hypothetical protein
LPFDTCIVSSGNITSVEVEGKSIKKTFYCAHMHVNGKMVSFVTTPGMRGGGV